MLAQALRASAPAVILSKNRAVTTSKNVADYFGKQHKHVLDAIENLKAECPESFIEPNFRLIEIEAKVGFGVRRDPAYEITRDGFTLLAMGFTGKKALQFKLAYIDAFNRMEAALRSEPPAVSKGNLSPELMSHLHRCAHEVALQQYNTIHATLEHAARRALAWTSGDEAAAFQSITATANQANGTVFVNIHSLQELVQAAQQTIATAGEAILAIRRVEQQSGLQLALRYNESAKANPAHPRAKYLVQEVLDRMHDEAEGASR